MRRWSGTFGLLVTLVLVAAWLLWLRPAMLGGSASYVIVTGTSMEPSLQGGDLAVLRHGPSYEPGDVIAFRADGGLVIHRIVGGTADEGYAVKGDNKEREDPWTPKPEHIVGRMWFHIPGLGLVIKHLQEPLVLGVVVGGISMLSAAGFGTSRLRGRRRNQRGRTPARQIPRPSPGALLLACATLLCAGSGTLAAYAFTQPLSTERFAEHARIEHTATFDYEVHLRPSALYPATVLQPDDLGAAGDPATTGRLYTNLVRRLDVRFRYAAEGAPADAHGEYAAHLRITAENGWSKTLPLVGSTRFSGPQVDFAIPVDVPAILELLKRIEEEIEYKPAAYDLEVLPSVRLAGNSSARAVEDEYVLPFSIRINGKELALDRELSGSETKSFGESVTDENQVLILGNPVPVGVLRGASVTTFAITMLLAIAGGFLVTSRWHRGRSEFARCRSRLRPRLISADEVEVPADASRIVVGSFEQLARFAEREEQTIVHVETEESDLYLVFGQRLVCEYRPRH